MTEQIAPVELCNGLVIRFEDQTNRYFGDFHRICVQVRIELPTGIDRKQACLLKNLEKMAVPSSGVTEQRNALIESFLKASRDYLETDEAPQRLLQRLQQQKAKPNFSGRREIID